jgi:hypothetical protein
LRETVTEERREHAALRNPAFPGKARLPRLSRPLRGRPRKVVRHAETARRQVARGRVPGIGLAPLEVEGAVQHLRDRHRTRERTEATAVGPVFRER